VQFRFGAGTDCRGTSGEGRWNRLQEIGEAQGRGTAWPCREGHQLGAEGRHMAERQWLEVSGWWKFAGEGAGTVPKFWEVGGQIGQKGGWFQTSCR